MFYFALIPFRFSISANSSEIFSEIFHQNFVRNFDILENIPVQIKSVTSEKELSQIDQTWDLGCFIIFVAIAVLNENFHTTEIFVTTSPDTIRVHLTQFRVHLTQFRVHDPYPGPFNPISGPRPISGSIWECSDKSQGGYFDKITLKVFLWDYQRLFSLLDFSNFLRSIHVVLKFSYSQIVIFLTNITRN